MTDKEKPSKPKTAAYLEASLASAEEIHGKDNPSIIEPLNEAAEFHIFHKNYQHAAELLHRAHSIAEAGHNYEELKLAKQKLGWLAFLEEKFSDAERFFQEAYSTIAADSHANEDSIAQALRSLAYFYLKTDKLDAAGDSIKKLLDLYQQNKQESNYPAAFALVSLAVVADWRESADDAKQFAEKAAEIIKDKCAIGYTVDFLSLSEIINLYFGQERKIDVRQLVACTMLECEDSFWHHNIVAGDEMAKLAEFMRGQRKYKQAESLYKRAITVKEVSEHEADPEYARITFNLGNMYLGLRKYADAEPLVKGAMKTRVKCYGVEHPAVAACVETYATILRKTKRTALANKLDTRAREIRSSCVAKLDRQLSAQAAQA